jgi:beta-glucosidase
VRFVNPGFPVTDMGWPVDPTGLSEVLESVHALAPDLPLFVTENGAAYPDDVVVDGRVQDDDRTAYLDGHLRACAASIARGVPLRGYFAWSLMDNFEWALGYGKRFGLVRVDYDTLERTPKRSAEWYAALTRRQ